MKIGVFDSGIGGLSVANAIKLALPEHQVIFKNDAKHVPYGSKTMDEVLAYVIPVLESLVEDGVDCIVIACNTVSTNLMNPLRQLISVPLIATEPLVEEAAKLSKSGVITVCATPATLTSQRYADLKNQVDNIRFIEPDCSDWAEMIEVNKVDRQSIASRITDGLKQGSDVIVLACTHYHWIEEEIKQLAKNKAAVIQPEPVLIDELKQVLARLA